VSGRIFISYRRDDDPGSAGRVFDVLERTFGADQIFIDVDYIEPGLDFAQVIKDRLAQSDVLLAVIGGRWSDIRDADGNRRLDNEADFVRLEIEIALTLRKRVIPVLVGNARMLSPDILPPSLRPLTLRNAVQIRHERFRSDTEVLVKALKRILDDPANRPDAQTVETKPSAASHQITPEMLPPATDAASPPMSDRATPSKSAAVATPQVAPAAQSVSSSSAQAPSTPAASVAGRKAPARSPEIDPIEYGSTYREETTKSGILYLIIVIVCGLGLFYGAQAFVIKTRNAQTSSSGSAIEAPRLRP
jgi:hypothetical protein